MKTFKSIIAAMLLFMPAVTNAETADIPVYQETEAAAPTHFILCLNDGQQVTFLLEHNPKVVNGEGLITVVDGDYTIEYPLDNVHKYMMGTDDAHTGIEGIKAEPKVNGDIAQKAGNIMLTGFDAGAPVKVTALNGTIVFASSTDANGALILNMSQYPSGVYIVKAQNQTFKFIKR